jgi:hypothetical protein
LGGSAASASGACTDKRMINPKTGATGLRRSMQSSPSLFVVVHGRTGTKHSRKTSGTGWKKRGLSLL